MTPKEKALELLNKYLCIDDDVDLFCDECGMSEEAAKQCALIAVDQIVKLLLITREDYKKTSQIISCFKDAKSFDENLKHTREELDYYAVRTILYWGDVKREIQSL